jgi:hypothetical protein
MDRPATNAEPPSASVGALYCALAVVILQPILQLTTGLYLIVLIALFFGLPCDRPLDVWLLCYLLGLVGSTTGAAVFWTANRRVDIAAEEGQENLGMISYVWWVAGLGMLSSLLFTSVWFIFGAVVSGITLAPMARPHLFDTSSRACFIQWAFESSPDPTLCSAELRLNVQYFFYYLFGATGFQFCSSPVLSWINTLNPEPPPSQSGTQSDSAPQARV